MITQTNLQGPESNSLDVFKDMSPQSNMAAPSFEDDEFDIPQVTLPAGAILETADKPEHVHHGQYQYHDQYYQQPQQWVQQPQGDYHQYHQYHPQQQQHYPQQYPQYVQQYPHQQYHEDPWSSHRSPGSHSTPSPMSQPDQHQDNQEHFLDNKRPQETIIQPVKKPKPSRRKKKKDPNEPTKPVSAYALFFRDSQVSIKSRNPNMSFGEVSKMVASLWDSLDADSKAHYKKRTELAKKEYLRALAAYRTNMVSKGHDEMYGYMGGYTGHGPPNYAPMDPGHHPNSIVQNIPPHPHPHPVHHHHPQQHHHLGGAATFVTNSQDYLSNQQHHQATAHHGTDITTGNHQISSLPVSSAREPQVTRPSCDQVYPSMDTNHNTMVSSTGASEQCCARPGCTNTVTKAEDGTLSTYCSSQCVMGQCRDAYSGWEQQQCRPQQQQEQPIVKVDSN